MNTKYLHFLSSIKTNTNNTLVESIKIAYILTESIDFLSTIKSLIDNDELTIDIFTELHKNYNHNSKIYELTNDTYLNIYNNNKAIIIDDSFSEIIDINSFIIHSVDCDIIPVEYKKIFDDFSDTINNNFWKNPITLYHATDDDNVNDILDLGIFANNYTRSISNTHINNAVFTSSDMDEIKVYGSSIFKIDTKLMKSDGYTPYIYKEPDIEIKMKCELLASIYNFDDFYIDIDSSVSDNTFIFSDNIPKKYITLI